MKRTIKRNGEITLNVNLDEYATIVSLLYKVKTCDELYEFEETVGIKGKILKSFFDEKEINEIKQLYNDIK